MNNKIKDEVTEIKETESKYIVTDEVENENSKTNESGVQDMKNEEIKQEQTEKQTETELKPQKVGVFSKFKGLFKKTEKVENVTKKEEELER